jgi:biotin carboxylase
MLNFLFSAPRYEAHRRQNEPSMTILCLSSYLKGEDFIIAAKQTGATVILISSESLNDAPWPWTSIDEAFFMPVIDGQWVQADLVKAISYVARTRSVDRIVALDDLDLEKAAMLREHLRVPGMGDTRTRYFRDKLAMRMRARESGIPVPDFVHVLNHPAINEFFESVPGPWVLKPRSAAGSIGVQKVDSSSQAWQLINQMGDEQSFHLIEQYVPGDVFHVDSVVIEGEVVFAAAHAYMDAPMVVAHAGGIFRSHSLDPDDSDLPSLLEINRKVMTSMGLVNGVSHTEFIKSEADGQFYFLETSARVGGAHISEMIEAETGLNLWREWAKIELLEEGESYELPELRQDQSGIVITLARQEHPDMSGYDDEEVVWKLDKRYHAGIIIRASTHQHLVELMESYAERFKRDFHATMPMGDIPPP